MAYGGTRYAAGTYAAGAEVADLVATPALAFPLGYIGASQVMSVAPADGTLVGTSHVDVVVPELES